MKIPPIDESGIAGRGWEASTMTRTGTRWGCFLPDLTRLASGASTTSLPASISSISLSIASQTRNYLLRHSANKRMGRRDLVAFELNERRWPWLILVPQRAGIEELFELRPLDQALLTFECNLAAEALKKVTVATKVNVGALGNIVRQLHIHVIARHENDANWPGPVWGFGTREPYGATEKKALIDTIVQAL
jgi:diadenosine tetraphosphate (Ap4A) HIT family hydrolase